MTGTATEDTAKAVATLAAAIGCSSNSLNTSVSGLPSSASIVFFAFANENGGSLSWRRRSCELICGSHRSGRVLIT